MKTKDFFKSTSFKCIAVLLAIMLICGIFLTICNSLFHVTDEERFDRALQKIYGKSVNTTSVEFSDADVAAIEDAEILNARYVTDDGNYLIQSKGLDGFDGGTVTCWVVVEMNGTTAIKGVGNVVIDSNEKQTWINYNNDYLGRYSEEYVDGIVYEPIKTGATNSNRAITNAVNGALSFIKSVVLGEKIEVKTAYDDFAYTTYIDKEKTTHSFADGLLTYNVVTKGNSNPNAFKITVSVGADKTITAMEVTENGSTEQPYKGWTYDASNLIGKSAEEIFNIIEFKLKDDGKYDFSNDFYVEDDNSASLSDDEEITTGATQSSFLVVYAALFATDNYDKAIASAYAYTQYISDTTTYSVEGDVVTYNVVTKGNSNPNAFKITISVGADKTITAMEVADNGSTEQPYKGWTYDASNLIGKSAEEILNIIDFKLKDDGKYNSSNDFYVEDDNSASLSDDEEITTGATQSSFLVVYAALYATANYDLALIVGGAN